MERKSAELRGVAGFSKEIVAILGKHSGKFSTFDILSDNDVREGLKKLSNWPTYPQLYVNGELVGGVDVVKELEASGELDQMLPKSETVTLDDRSVSSLSLSAPHLDASSCIALYRLQVEGLGQQESCYALHERQPLYAQMWILPPNRPHPSPSQVS